MLTILKINVYFVLDSGLLKVQLLNIPLDNELNSIKLAIFLRKS